jgi:hypothetical protein
MKRSELEHILRASGEITRQKRIVVIGSQSILGSFPKAPAALLASMEADVYPQDRPDLADQIDGAIGEGSAFHEEFGYYAQGVGPETAILPAGWQERLVSVTSPNTGGVEGLCLEVHDLALSKYIAGREKDLRFVAVLAQRGLTSHATLLVRLAATDLDSERRSLATARIGSHFGESRPRRPGRKKRAP